MTWHKRYGYHIQFDEYFAKYIYQNPLFPSGLFINSVFNTLQNQTDVFLDNNFWDGVVPPTTPVNNNWSFRLMGTPQNQFIGTPWLGNINIGTPYTGSNDPAIVTCGGVQVRGQKEDALSKRTVINVNGVLRNVKVQHDAGFQAIYNNNFDEGVRLLSAIATLSNSLRDTTSPAVRHFILEARAVTLINGVQARSASNSWLPESIVGIVQSDNDFKISPNPTNEQFDITLPQGDYDIQVFDAIGKRVLVKNTEGVTTIDVHAWQNGIYMVSLLNKSTKKKTFSKVVVQH